MIETVAVKIILLGFVIYYARITYTGISRKAVIFMEQEFSRAKKPGFYWAMTITSAFLTYAFFMALFI